MAEGTNNVEDRLSCNDSSYSERNLEVSNSSDGVNNGSEEVQYSGGDTDALGKEPYQFKPTRTDRTTLRLHPASTSAQDSLGPLQLALVLIFS